jgi:hypothetical protein
MLNNGCLCCTVRDDLVNALNKLWERRSSIDHIIIETTGRSIIPFCLGVAEGLGEREEGGRGEG